MPAIQVRERQILFSGPMVRAILDGAKTQTRRIAKIEYRPRSPWPFVVRTGPTSSMHFPTIDEFNRAAPAWCPYGEPGDRLWVRETWKRATIGGAFLYRADYPGAEGSLPWRPSIFMPREACRLVLEVTGVRVERIQDISHADAIAEGVVHAMGLGPASAIPAADFKKRWNELNAKRGFGWDANPWVWVIEFRRVA